VDATTIAQDVLKFLAESGMELSDDLAQAEAVVRQQMLKIGAAALEQHLKDRKPGYEGSSRVCACGGRQRFVEYRPKTLATLVGPVTIRRAYYRCGNCGASCLPYDERVGLGRGQVSVGLARVGCLLGALDPFAVDAKLLYELTRQRLSARTIARLTHQVGQVAAEEESASAARMRHWNAPEPEATPDRLYVAVDGVMVHENDGYHEAKTAVCYWKDRDGKRQSQYSVRFETAAVFAAFVWSLACRCGMKTAREVVLLGDGAKWIWDQIAPLLEGATCIVDWYHAMEHVWDCGRKLHGEGTEATTAWVKIIESLLWDGDVRGILERLRADRARARSPSRRKALSELMTYLENQDDRLAYDRFRARGLDIGSGPVEAACKHVVGTRMKRSGMRWSRRGSQATLSLRVAWLNGHWEILWAQRPLAA